MLRQYELVEKVKEYDPQADEAMINRAYVFTVQKHGSQKRASGDPYFSHPVEVAGILTELKLDTESVVTALLHDTLEDTIATAQEIEDNFGAEVARLVDGVTKLSAIEAQEISAETDSEKAAENLRKFLLAMSDDIRVLLVKLADRLHNMRTLHFIANEAKRRRIARETMDIYAPLAERIGMYEFMREMQLLAFKELEPDAYETICDRLRKLSEGGEKKVEKIAKAIRKVLAEGGVEAEVSGREKHPYSIWKKMQERHVAFEQLTDIIAFRVITDNADDCYRAMGVLHRHWKMVPGRFKDYISTPKRNGYRSLHTTVITRENMRIEIQIRDTDMHRKSEYGLAAHWAYKQGDKPDGQASWIRDLMEILDQTQDADELLEHTRMAMYQDRIFAFTPKGALHQMPKGATPVDFAYDVHTDLGDQAVGAKVNGRIAPLRTLLQNGDIVEILSSEKQVPQAGWLSFVVTGKARSAVRRHIRHKERDEVTAIGRKLYEDILDRIPARIGKKAEAAARERLKMADADALHYAIGKHALTDEQVMEALVPGILKEKSVAKRPSRRGSAISIKGLSAGVAFGLAECCHPLPGDRIVGLRREGERIEVHAIDCDVLANGEDADWVDLSWSEDSEGGTARLTVVMRNEPGMLAEVSSVFALNRANILNLRLTNREGDFHTFMIDVEVDDIHHLMRILSALRASDAVAQAERD
ncbi:MAG: bifunctional (p)ppGpp synthetase/guanosine-3',5'-bis(diphosphate) 3'-pyrophosphohydrolase [Sphingomonadales bacterium]|nr:bifunctional (p)ppGpp synthetase/guanosine-3',5'-bis(diphosphate) 3'-pyrophosphohydrolase [Sphingomonadales bacterium]